VFKKLTATRFSPIMVLAHDTDRNLTGILLSDTSSRSRFRQRRVSGVGAENVVSHFTFLLPHVVPLKARCSYVVWQNWNLEW